MTFSRYIIYGWPLTTVKVFCVHSDHSLCLDIQELKLVSRVRYSRLILCGLGQDICSLDVKELFAILSRSAIYLTVYLVFLVIFNRK